MAETDILNPVRGHWDVLGDNPNWSYGWTRRSSQNGVLARTRLGSWYTRETLNAGYVFDVNFVDRPWATVLRLKQFHENFANGYFTLIDWDGGGRHHVGRFTSPPNGVETANGKYTVQGVVFEEIPRCRMLQYPSDFVASSHTIYAVDDFLKPRVATQGVGWVAGLVPAMAGIANAQTPAAYELSSAAPAAGDFAQVEYVGWGFQMSFRTSPTLGLCDIYVDGVLWLQAFDLSTGLAATVNSSLGGVIGNTFSASPFINGFVSKIDLPLDKHRVKVVARNAPGAASIANGVIFPPIQAIH